MTPEELKTILEDLGLERITRRSNDYQALCPAHLERNPSWGISLHSPHPHGCYACGYKGTLFSLLVLHGGKTPKQARILIGEKSVEFQLPSFSNRVNKKEIAPDELFPYVLAPEARAYLHSRGIDTATAKKARCLYDRHKRRVLFPWYFDGKLVGVTGRAIDENAAKVLPYFDTKKSEWVYLPQGKIAKQPFIICEGEISALKVFAAGYTNVGALGFGTFTQKQKELLLHSRFERLVLFLDDDERGREIAKKIFNEMKSFVPIDLVNYREFQKKHRGIALDPAELTRTEISLALTDRLIKCVSWPSF